MEKPHKRLEVWKQSMDLVLEIYQVTKQFPINEGYGIAMQIRRAAVSVPSNIAEGAARQTKKEFMNFLHIAQGSLSELDTQIDIASRLEYINLETRKRLDDKMQPVDKMITGLIRRLSKK
jgi:four helix bundle protein